MLKRLAVVVAAAALTLGAAAPASAAPPIGASDDDVFKYYLWNTTSPPDTAACCVEFTAFLKYQAQQHCANIIDTVNAGLTRRSAGGQRLSSVFIERLEGFGYSFPVANTISTAADSAYCRCAELAYYEIPPLSDRPCSEFELNYRRGG
jgi:hypothetical protein